MITLEERLRSRFEWGLTADIQPPDLETSLAILHSKSERMRPSSCRNPGSDCPQDAVQHPRVQGALNRMVAYADLRGIPLTADLVDTALIDLLPKRKEVAPRGYHQDGI